MARALLVLVGMLTAMPVAHAMTPAVHLAQSTTPKQLPPGTPGDPPTAPQAVPTPDMAPALERAGSPAERKRVLSELYAQLAAATNAENADAIATAIQRFWAISGSDTVDLLISRSNMALAAQDVELALELMGASITLAPDNPEVWNQRAAIHFSASRFVEALADLNRALTLDPNHFKALEGAALTLKEIGRKSEALATFRRLLAVHPFSEGGKRGAEELERTVEGQKI